MRMRRFIVIATVLFAAGCGSPQSTPGSQAPAATSGADAAAAVQLGGPPSSAGTSAADTGEIKPADPAMFYKKPGYSPYAGRNYPERPYFGDEHVHTAWSVDAGG